jgi:PAS domain S-box-containing protein
MNPSAERLTGWSRDQAQGKLVREIWKVTTFAGEVVVKCRLERALLEGTAAIEQRFFLLNRHGHQIPIEDSATPILESGRVTGAISVFRDISNSLRRERELEEDRERLEEQVQLTESALGNTRSELRALSGHLLSAQEEERRHCLRICGALRTRSIHLFSVMRGWRRDCGPLSTISGRVD